MSETAITEATRTELEDIVLLLTSDVRQYRDKEQKRLNDPTIAFSDMLITVGKVKALRDILEVLRRFAELYKLEI